MLTINDFFKRYGTSTSTNFQLMHWAKQLKIKNFQILMRDELKNINTNYLPINVITNIHTSKENGIHWSCFHVDKNNKKYWFDSYALPPPKELTTQFSQILGNTFKLQELETQSYCGQISLYVLYSLNNGECYEKIILELNESH